MKNYCVLHSLSFMSSIFGARGGGAFFKKNFKTPLDRNIIIQSSYEVEILQKDTPVENMRTGNIFM